MEYPSFPWLSGKLHLVGPSQSRHLQPSTLLITSLLRPLFGTPDIHVHLPHLLCTEHFTLSEANPWSSLQTPPSSDAPLLSEDTTFRPTKRVRNLELSQIHRPPSPSHPAHPTHSVIFTSSLSHQPTFSFYLHMANSPSYHYFLFELLL